MVWAWSLTQPQSNTILWTEPGLGPNHRKKEFPIPSPETALASDDERTNSLSPALKGGDTSRGVENCILMEEG